MKCRSNTIRPVPGYEGLYAVTRAGRVWAYPKKSRLKGRWLAICTGNNGYEYVCLFNGQRQNHKIHRLVASAFLPHVAGKDHVNHKNGVKADNRLSNLEWCNAKENTMHAYAIGLKGNDEEHLAKFLAGQRRASKAKRKLTARDIKKIRLLYKAGTPQRRIAQMFNVCRSTVKKRLKEGYQS